MSWLGVVVVAYGLTLGASNEVRRDVDGESCLVVDVAVDGAVAKASNRHVLDCVNGHLIRQCGTNWLRPTLISHAESRSNGLLITVLIVWNSGKVALVHKFNDEVDRYRWDAPNVFELDAEIPVVWNYLLVPGLDPDLVNHYPSALYACQGRMGNVRTALRLKEGMASVVDGVPDAEEAEKAQRELRDRYIKGGIGRNRLPGLNLQSPLIAILGLLALGLGYGIAALTHAPHRVGGAPADDKDRDRDREKSDEG